MAFTLRKPEPVPDQAPPMLSPVFMDTERPGGEMAPNRDPGEGMVRLPQDAQFPTTAPPVVAPDQLEQVKQQQMGQLQKVQMQEARPWGFKGAAPSAEFPQGLAPNHPGTMGKIAHVLSVAGNIAGDIVAPDRMALIPGTQMYMKAQEAKAQKGVEDIAKQQSEQALQGAQTESAQAEVPLRKAQGREAEARANALENPPAKEEHWTVSPDYTGPNGEPVEVEQNSGQMRIPGESTSFKRVPAKESTSTPPHITAMVGGQPHIMERDPSTGAYSIDRGIAPPNYAMVAPGVTTVVPNAQGGGTVQRVMPGQTMAPGSISPTTFSSLNAPTTATRSMIEIAPNVIALADRAEQLIDPQVQTLGPLASRWSEFMAGKVGAPNKEFTQLRTNIGLLSTALMRMHVGARGGEKIMEHFQDLIDSSKQDPTNLKAALDEIRSYAHAVMAETGPGASAIANAANPAPSTSQPIVQQSPSTGQFRHSTDGGKTWQPGKPPQNP